MKIGKLVYLVGVPCAFLLGPVSATYADAYQGPAFYLGGSWGAYSVDQGDLDEHDNLLKGFIGAQFNSWFGVEGTWTDLNKVKSGLSNFDSDGKGLAAVLSLPFSDSSAVFIKGGQFWWDGHSTIGNTVGDGDGDDPFYGIGVNFGFTPNLAVRLEGERYDVMDIDLDTVSIGLQYTF
jgi:hypothetical protein